MRGQLLDNLLSFRSGTSSSLGASHIKETKILLTDKAKRERERPEVELHPDIARLLPESQEDFMHIPLDYQGFCVHALSAHDGLLVPGQPTLGVFRYKDLHLVFRSEEAIRSFNSDPDKVLLNIPSVLLKRPELIHLLRLQAD